MVFSVIFPRRPVSGNKKPNPKYREALKRAAAASHQLPPLTGPLYSRIIWFHKSAAAQGDVDNIAKQIHDSLCDIVYLDDDAITQSLSIRVNASEQVELISNSSDNSALATIYDHLADDAVRDFIYIEIGPCDLRQIYIGPVR